MSSCPFYIITPTPKGEVILSLPCLKTAVSYSVFSELLQWTASHIWKCPRPATSIYPTDTSTQLLLPLDPCYVCAHYTPQRSNRGGIQLVYPDRMSKCPARLNHHSFSLDNCVCVFAVWLCSTWVAGRHVRPHCLSDYQYDLMTFESVGRFWDRTYLERCVFVCGGWEWCLI